MSINPLGKQTVYKPYYDRTLLFPIPRSSAREKGGIDGSLFSGYDIWNCYELSYLTKRGLPVVRRCRIVYSSDSAYIVESKSLKLYLGSFIMTEFADDEAAAETIKKDLQDILAASFVNITLYDYSVPYSYVEISPDMLLDNIEAECVEYNVNPNLLEVKEKSDITREGVYSNLLKTNCPITGQPDWATVYVEYSGKKSLTRESLLKYIVSYREHGDYHENCCEKIFTDIYNILKPEYLIVKCFFTRRGGIDINPCRYYGIEPDNNYNERFWRQ